MPTATMRPPLVPRIRPRVIPLSFAQRRLWFLHRLEGPGPNYNEPIALRFADEADPDALTQALADLIDRHESLRTRYIECDGLPCQEILPTTATRPALIVRHVSDAQMQEAMTAALQQRFDLTIEPPLRAYLFILDPSEHVLLLVMHHIAMDGWSIQRVLLKEIAHAYAARRAGVPPDLAPLPVQYADYTLWQLELLGDEDDPDSLMARQLAYWTATLGGLPEQLPLPTDRPRPAIASFRGGTVPLDINRPLHAALLALARQQRATLFMVLQAAVAALLTRLGAGTDIAVGTPVSGRTTPVVSGLVGFFANTLVIRTDTSGQPTFRDLLTRVRRTVLDACAHEDLPFERLVEALKPSRSLARNPLFQVMVGLQTLPPLTLTADKRATRMRLRLSDHARFDLHFDFFERRAPGGEAHGVAGMLHYSTDLFEPATVTRMVARLQTLLESVVADPDRRIEAIDLLTESERQQLMQVDAATPLAIAPALLHERIEQQAARTPQATAVVCEDHRVTFQELNEQANRIAHHLIAAGVGPDAAVGLAMPRAPEMLVALLGILKAGGAVLPLDPTHPAEHLARLLVDVGPRWVLATGDAQRALPDGTPLILLDADQLRTPLSQLPAQLAATNPTNRHRRRALLGEHAAFITVTARRFTPVVITHAGLQHLLSALAQALPIDANTDTVTDTDTDAGAACLAASTIGSDVGLIELLRPLCEGGTVILASDAELLYPSALARAVERRGHAIAPGLPSMHRALWPYLSEERHCTTLVGRGPLTSELARDLAGVSRRIVQLYGTTEATGWSTCAPIDPDARAKPSIGRPLGQARVYILDRELRPAPLDVPGDLYIAGPGLARGYHARPAMTAMAFVADPYGAPGARMHRTGDRARWRGGQLEFLGRGDELVQIDGVSVDLGVVDAALLACDDVHDAAVAPVAGPHGQRRLAAYVVAASGAPLDDATLVRRLERHLPKASVPQVIVPMADLSLTPHGVVDRDALPPPIFRAAGSRTPETPIETTLCAVFAEVLRVPRVGLDDNFFELGGHSLLVMQVINRARAALGITIDVRTLFDAPTVASLSRQL